LVEEEVELKTGFGETTRLTYVFVDPRGWKTNVEWMVEALRRIGTKSDSDATLRFEIFDATGTRHVLSSDHLGDAERILREAGYEPAGIIVTTRIR
jgi:hypothetical protein